MIQKLKSWWERRQLDKAQALIESYGLTIVQLQQRAGTTYLVNPDGTFYKLSKDKK